jgi:site-specific DNA-methyltransferase (adenine-specific)
MKPYFETKLGKLYCGNCADIIPEIEPADMVLTSPPYDDLRDYQGYSFDFEKVANCIYNNVKIGGVVVWVVGDATINGSETGTSFKQALYFKNIGFNLHDTMIYMKDSCPFPGIKRYLNVFEYMFILSKYSPKTINLIKDKKNIYANKIIKGRTERQKNGEVVKLKPIKVHKHGTRENIWKYSVGYMKTTRDKNSYQHPAMFPEALATDHIISWSDPGDLVLDPFSGSGTTAKMCELNNRRWIGIEISEKYCEIAAKRIEKENQQLKLF